MAYNVVAAESALVYCQHLAGVLQALGGKVTRTKNDVLLVDDWTGEITPNDITKKLSGDMKYINKINLILFGSKQARKDAWYHVIKNPETDLVIMGKEYQLFKGDLSAESAIKKMRQSGYAHKIYAHMYSKNKLAYEILMNAGATKTVKKSRKKESLLLMILDAMKC